MRYVVTFIVAACGASPPETATPTPTQTPAAPPTITISETAALTPSAPPPDPLKTAPIETGFASWYGAALAGHKTASGERFDPSQLTAAHRTLKMGTWLEVKRTDNGRIVRVRINDRGPVSHRFVIDLSHEAAEQLGMVRMGVAPVELRLVPR